MLYVHVHSDVFSGLQMDASARVHSFFSDEKPRHFSRFPGLDCEPMIETNRESAAFSVYHSFGGRRWDRSYRVGGAAVVKMGENGGAQAQGTKLKLVPSVL
jgi:hypothetical protein